MSDEHGVEVFEERQRHRRGTAVVTAAGATVVVGVAEDVVEAPVTGHVLTVPA